MSMYDTEAEKVLEQWAASKYALFEHTIPNKESPANPLIEASEESGDWREYGASGPLVVYNPDVEKYFLFCRGFSEDYWPNGIPQIGLFTSEDLLNWEEHPDSPVIPRGGSGEWDEDGVNSSGGTIIYDRDADRWLLYYWGIDSDDTKRIGVAESTDLVDWSKRTENPIVSTRAASGSVRCMGVFYRGKSPSWIAVVLDDGRKGELSGGLPLEVYTSSDGISWDFDREQVIAPEADPVLSSNVYPHVPEIFQAQRMFGKFVIIYEAVDLKMRGQYYISALTSYDGKHWSQIPETLYQNQAYAQASPLWQIIHPYVYWSKDGCYLFHASSLGRGGSHREWIEATRINPEWLRKIITKTGVNTVWDSESVTGGTYGYSWVNALNHDRITIHFTSDTSGDLTVEVDPDGQGGWRELYTRSSITEDVTQTSYDFTHLRAKFSVDATLTLKAIYG